MTEKSASVLAIEACFQNARDLLRSARTTLNAEKLPHIAFHLALLALEEVGKGFLIGARHMAIANGDEPTFMDRRLDDHIFKLFWAIWTPLFKKGKIDQAEWKQYQGLAKSLHDERLSSLYVGIIADADTPALTPVSDEKVAWLISLVEARLGMEETRDWQTLDLKPSSDIIWLMEASEDPVRRRQIYGGKSFEKLAELGNMVAWVKWIRSEFEKAEAQAAELLRKEMARELPTEGDPGQEKWRIRVRFYSTAQSVKSSAVNAWNAHKTWISLSTVQNDKFAIDVEITLREAFSLDRVPLAGYDVARTMLVALNMGSTGFWWWHRDPAPGQYYERFTDLNAPDDKSLGFKMAAPPPLQWKREALREPEFDRVALCLGSIGSMKAEDRRPIQEPYLMGLAFLGKSDMHLGFAPQACERFAACLLAAMSHFGDWDGKAESIATSIGKTFEELNQAPEDMALLSKQLLELHTRTEPTSKLDMDRAAVMKVLCDAYMIRRFQETIGDVVERHRENGVPGGS